MLAIEVEYLLGRAVATDVSQRNIAEWPPHPSRLFSALVDALADVKHESDAEHARCEAALRWFETLPAPEISASLGEDVSVRTPVKYWVPINDESVSDVRSAPLVEQRKRQERFFPTVVPSEPIVVFAWPDVDPGEEHGVALDRLVERISYLGHSSSVVRIMRRADAPASSIAPALSGSDLLRVPGTGRLDRLNAVHELRKSDTLVQPPRGREVPYRRVRRDRPRGPHGSGRVVALEGVSLGLESMAQLLVRYRAALLSLLGDDAPEVLTGHAIGGRQATSPHIAYVPLANIDHGFADGAIKGIAVVLPRDMRDEDVVRLDLAMSRLRRLHFGRLGDISLRMMGAQSERKSLDFRRYATASMTWVSVTPIALSVHPKPRKGLTEESAILMDFARLGLPEPTELRLQDAPFVRGAPLARQVPNHQVTSAAGRLLRHVHIRFPRHVEGPLLVGAGRYMGFGLLLPRG